MDATGMKRPAARLLVRAVLPVLALFALNACVTDEEYARQLCLQKGISSGSSGYESCLGEQRIWIEDNRQRDTYPHLNG